ncbi:hypothetical protein J6590_008270 [Homalodisca vitripennis]|nr:hypothetical protein J6590_008270 [Homalodisca vitripennis]
MGACCGRPVLFVGLWEDKQRTASLPSRDVNGPELNCPIFRYAAPLTHCRLLLLSDEKIQENWDESPTSISHSITIK